MKMGHGIGRNFFLMTFGLISLFLSVSSFSQEKGVWHGTIEEEMGVKVIKNPEEPLFGEFTFDFEEDLIIGNKVDDNHTFYRIRGITVDNEGNIYVSDIGNCRVQIFDDSGKYVATAGRRGEGPGEFQGSLILRIDNNTGHIYVRDGPYSLEKFDGQAKHLETIKLDKGVSDFYLRDDGNIIAIQDTVSENELSRTLCIMDVKGSVVEYLAKFPWNISFQKKGETDIIAVNSYTHSLLLSKINEGYFVYAYSGEYRMNVIDGSGQESFRITKAGDPLNFTGAEKRKFKRSPLPRHKPFFYRIFSDSEGRIYTQTNLTRMEPVDFIVEVDIFSKDGYFLYRAKLPRVCYCISNGYMYRYYWDDNSGEELVKRYKIINWDQLKMDIN